MTRRRFFLTHRKQRPILTDMLPFEVPPTFSNRGFYRFLRDHSVEIDGDRVQWICDDDSLDTAMMLIFGVKPGEVISTEALKEWGRPIARRSFPFKSCRMDTTPFNFRVAHKLDGRVLSVVHPRNQISVANFYARHGALIIYYTSQSEFSIRHPVSVSRFAYFNDGLHASQLDEPSHGVEEEDREYEQLGSYFVYRKYRNIHRFFESYKYHRSEKKYDAMVQIDISKCFDSVYTHSLPWSVLGKAQTKFAIDESKATFAGRFDALMQNLNHKETNGIVIGPEFSRIFAEIILQAVDAELLEKLLAVKLTHKVDYEVFRYVDDYFVFYNEESTKAKVIETLQDCLKAKKLSINAAKLKVYQKPIITEITVAKESIASLFNAELDPSTEVLPGPVDTPKLKLVCAANANRLIIKFKAVIKGAGVEYGDLLNYTFAILENKLRKLLSAYADSERSLNDQKSLMRALLAMLEFAFFAYSASPKVNHTIRVCRLVTTAVKALLSNNVPYEMRHLVFKYVHDNVLQMIDKNTMSLHREVESLYLLISLSQIGREYWLPEKTLLKHFLIAQDPNTGEYSRADYLNHFSITVLLSYIKSKVRYNKLRSFLQSHAVEKLGYMKAHCPHDAETLMLLLDLVVCPFIDGATKLSLADVFGLDAVQLGRLEASNRYWFTVWGDDFDLGKELDAKRSREVY